MRHEQRPIRLGRPVCGRSLTSRPTSLFTGLRPIKGLAPINLDHLPVGRSRDRTPDGKADP